MTSNSASATAAISVPQGGGALHGIGETFSPDLFTGTGNFSVPLALPDGRNGFQPELTLSYSTGNGNGPFGLGWSVSVPSISRKTSHGLPMYDESDTFLLSGAEDLVKVSASGDRTTYRPRTEGLFARIERVQNASVLDDYWEVATKDGFVSRYGTPGASGDDAAAVANPESRGKVYLWRLSKTTDPFGNQIAYDYARDLMIEGPHRWDQLYLKRVRYVDFENAGTTEFLVSVEFYYDFERGDAPLAGLTPTVGVRKDPFSEYRSTFEIRTRRRCALIVVSAHPVGAASVPIRAYRLLYLDERQDLPNLDAALPPNSASLLSRIEVIGYDDAGNPARDLPPLDFSYSRFEPAGRRFVPVPGSGREIPSVASPNLELVDLHGGGLPDIMEMSGSVRYWRNLGGGKFSTAREMREAPLGLALNDAGVALLDANGDGRADLLIQRPEMSATFSLEFGPVWKRRPALPKKVPSFDFRDPEVKLIDLDGDGATDALRAGTAFDCFFNDASEGWERVRTVARRSLDEFPNVSFSDPRVYFADLTGDGQQDIVLIHSGSIEYWPNLGRGDWGRRIAMHASPRFPWGYDPRRILLGDLDGDGLADLVYADTDRVFVWFNRSGNGWSVDPVEIAGTPQTTDLDSVRIVDLYGNGVNGILFSSINDRAGRPTMYFLDLAGGVKPYLLTEMDNNLGATTRVRYVPSTVFYLEDEEAPLSRWRTRLPFPVQAVARVEMIDRLAGGKSTTEYRYHHGYWDGAEREFRGFGMVEQFDSEVFDDYHEAGLHGSMGAFGAVSRKYFSPPTMTRSWFHLGPVGEEFGEWSEQDYSAEFWSGDEHLLNHKQGTDAFIRGLPTRGIRRDALRALRGNRMRTELYALDASRHEHRPHTVTESSYGLREESRPSQGEVDRRRIFFPFVTAQRTTQWERGDDPLSVFSFSADFDAFGQPRQETSVAMPRRSSKRRGIEGAVVGVIQPDETRVLVTHALTHRAQPDQAVVGVSGARHIHDRVWQTHGFEPATPPTLTESDPNHPSQVLREQYTLARQLHDGYVASLRSWAPGSAVPAALSLISHVVNHFDGAGFAGRDDGKVVFGALTRSESLVFTGTLLDAACADGTGSRRPAYLEGTTTLPAGAPMGLGTGLGYQRRSNAPYQNGWYSDATRQQFDFQTTGAAPAGWSVWPTRGQALGAQDALGLETTHGLDRYWLLPVTVTDPIGLQVSATYNLRVMQPDSVTDPNGNTTRLRFTPNGLPAKSWIESHDDANLNRSGGTETKPELSWTYDLLAYQRTRASPTPQPPSLRTTQRVWHASDGVSDETIDAVEYSDGFGRVIQKRAQAEDVAFGTTGDDVGLPAQAGALPATATAGIATDRVLVSGWQVYDNKGNVVERYEPFFDSGWIFQPKEDATQGRHVEIYYDARGQAIRTLNPDGSQQRVIYGRPIAALELQFASSDTDPIPANFEPTPWEIYTYDANDLAPVSIDDQGASLSPRAPTSHQFTPTTGWVNALGRPVCHVQRNGPAPGTDWYVTRSEYDIRGNLTTRFDALGRAAFRYAYDLANRSWRVESIDAGMRTSVLDALGNLVEYRDSKGAVALRTYDRLNRPSELWARNDSTGAGVTMRERITYGDAGSSTQAAAARNAAREINALGKPIEHWDEAGVQRFRRYDFKGNLLGKTRAVVSDATLAALPAVQPWVADWSQPNSAAALDPFEYRFDATFDALNRPTTVTHPDDVEASRRALRPRYNRAGGLDAVTLYASATAATGEDYIRFIAYNAAGQRVLVEYGNGLMTRYAYDNRTLRLSRMRTDRIATPRLERQWRGQGPPVQDCSYSYDLLGNITSIDERVAGCGVNGSTNGRDRLVRVFEYDAISRLVSATGRACVGRSSALADLPNCGSYDAPYIPGAPTPNQDNAPMLTEPYRQSFTYDPAGNMIEMDYDVLRTAGWQRPWVRRFGMGGAASTLWRSAPNNRLTTLTVDGSTYTYGFDPNGNLSQQNLDTFHAWDHADRMIGYRVQAGAQPSVNARYIYGADGMRVKKWVRKAAIEESTVYADALFEHHRSPQIPTTGQNNTLHVMDDQSRVSLVRLGNPHGRDASPAIVYHLGDHLGSSAVVVENGGAWINREEFFPYGETSLGSFQRKRYRLSGKETDEHSGATYYGARHYLPGLARWLSCDPIGLAGGVNLYEYCSSNPACRSDPDGSLDTATDQSASPSTSNLDTPALRLSRAEQRLFSARLAFAKGVAASILEFDANQLKDYYTPTPLQELVPDITIGEYDREDRGQSSWNPLEQALNESSVANDFAGRGFDLLHAGRDDEANQAFGNAGFWYGKMMISCVNLASIAAGAPAVVKAGGTFALETVGRLPRILGGRLTPFDHLRRFFVQDTVRHPGVGSSWFGRLLRSRPLQKLFPNLKWEQGHILIQKSWFKINGPNQVFPNNQLANQGLQRLGNAGWNLMPLPRGINNALGRMPLGTALFAGGTYSLLGIDLYWSGSKVKELADTVIEADR